MPPDCLQLLRTVQNRIRVLLILCKVGYWNCSVDGNAWLRIMGSVQLLPCRQYIQKCISSMYMFNINPEHTPCSWGLLTDSDLTLKFMGSWFHGGVTVSLTLKEKDSWHSLLQLMSCCWVVPELRFNVKVIPLCLRWSFHQRESTLSPYILKRQGSQ